MGTSQVPAHTVGSLYSQFLFLPVAWVPEELHKLGQPPVPIVEAKDSNKPPDTSQGLRTSQHLPSGQSCSPAGKAKL